MKAWDRRAVLTFLDRVEPALTRLDYFELLDVAADADEQAIQDAFHAMAGALHPDRHRRTLDAAQHERLTTVYAKIAEAYRVLRDPDLRQAYLLEAARQRGAAASTAGQSQAASHLRDRRLSAGPPAHDADEPASEAAHLARLSPRAQNLYRRAQTALRTGDRTSALLNLRMALAAQPQSMFLREALTRIDDKK